MGKEGLKKSLELNCGEIGILEGAMGYFDGIGTTMEGSAYDISCKLDINSILVYKPQGEMMSMIPKIKGMVDFSKGRIKGIIFSKTRKMLYEQYKNLVEKHLDIEVLAKDTEDDHKQEEVRREHPYYATNRTKRNISDRIKKANEQEDEGDKKQITYPDEL